MMKNKKNLWTKIKSLIKKPSKTVAILNLHGVIGAHNIGLRKANLSLSSLKKDIDKTFDLSGLKAVVLSINSPGGAPVQAELIAKYIIDKSVEKKIPLYSFVEDIAASGGYWLACCGQEIYASRSSIIGSIGVISSGFGFVNTIKKLGITRRIITQGKNKSIYDPFLPEKDKDKEIIKSVQKDIHDEFKKLVKNSRKNKLKSSEEKLFSGEFWSGSKALELGLIDGIGDIYATMKEKYGKNIEFQTIEKEEGWLKRKLGISSNSNNNYDSICDSLLCKIKETFYFNRFGL